MQSFLKRKRVAQALCAMSGGQSTDLRATANTKKSMNFMLTSLFELYHGNLVDPTSTSQFDAMPSTQVNV